MTDRQAALFRSENASLRQELQSKDNQIRELHDKIVLLSNMLEEMEECVCEKEALISELEDAKGYLKNTILEQSEEIYGLQRQTSQTGRKSRGINSAENYLESESRNSNDYPNCGCCIL